MDGNLFARMDPGVLSAAIGAAMLVARRVGARFGPRAPPASRSKEEVSHADSIAQAALALASLLLAFSFATAYARHEDRRVQTVEEANAIGTLYLRLEVLPPGPREAAQKDLKEYVRLHLKAVAPALTRPERLVMERQIRVVQGRFAETITRFLRTPEGMPFLIVEMPALNAVIDQYEARIAGIDAHVPFTVLMLLLLVSVTSLGLLGWSESFTLPKRPRSTLLFLLLVTGALYVTFDLDQPWAGLSRLSELPMQRLAESLGVG
jgi:hypothetical protein